jgi:hypothetical protein
MPLATALQPLRVNQKFDTSSPGVKFSFSYVVNIVISVELAQENRSLIDI